MTGPLGFTGVDWDARTSEQLATDLGAGPGPGPLVEAGLAWAGLATEVGEAGVEYAAVLARLGLHWESAGSGEALGTLARLAPWFADTAAAAANNAVRAETHAAAVTVARLNMPDVAEVDVVEKLAEIATTATAVAPVIAGAAAEAERAVQRQRLHAARVMQAYEHAAEPVAQPWESGRPAPQLVSGDPLAAEQAAARAAAAPPPSPPTPPSTVVAGVPAFPGVIAPAVEKVRYTPTVLASGQAATPTPGSTPVGTTNPGGPALPPPVAPGLVTTADRTTTLRTGFDATAADAEAEDAGAAESDVPVTWEDIATTDRPVVSFAPVDAETDSPRQGLDPRYLSETLLLGDPGGRS